MKFGDTLWQRSVPQWRSYNIDYNSIKKLIKENTTPGQGKAVSIPGTGNSVERDFANQLFAILNNEHDRISLFIKSRWYEINSRLSSIGRQLSQIQGKDLSTLDQRAAWQLRRRFSRIESEILAVGEEIQNLSRFISINRQAVKKLCKKYTKWSKDTTLRSRVESDILNKPGNLSEAMLKPALEQYTTFLHDVRAPFLGEPETIIPQTARTEHTRRPSHTSELLSKSTLHFDTTLSLRSKGSPTAIAKYWIHVDNVTQLRILLLQHTRLAKFDEQDHRRPSMVTLHRTASISADGDDNFGLILLGDLEMHGSSYSNYLQDENGSSGGARWFGSSDAALFRTGAERDAADVLIAQVTQDRLYDLLDTRDGRPLSSSFDSNTEEGQIRQWLVEHANMKPLICIRGRKTRFVGLDNSNNGGLWASLDEEVDMSALSLRHLKNPDFFRNNTSSQHNRFEHAILTIRCDGDDRGLFRMLDKSHLTERVNEFSVERHALYHCHRPRSMSEPGWSNILHKDIRHVPEAPPITTRSRKSSSINLSSPRRSPRTSISHGHSTTPTTPTTAVAPDQSNLGPRIKSKLRQQKRLQAPIAEETQPAYWNEYDNPDSEFGGDDGGFVIYVDPDAPLYPGQKIVSRVYGSIRGLFIRSNTSSKHKDLERQTSSETLTGSTASSEDEDDETSSPKTVKTPLLARFLPSGYGGTNTVTTISANPPTTTRHRINTNSITIFTPPVQHSTLTSSTRLSTISLAASLIILAMIHVLASTARRKARTEVETFVLIGIVAALAFVGIGIGNLISVGSGIGGGDGSGEGERKWRSRTVLGVKWIVALGACVWAGWLGMSLVVV